MPGLEFICPNSSLFKDFKAARRPWHRMYLHCWGGTPAKRRTRGWVPWHRSATHSSPTSRPSALSGTYGQEGRNFCLKLKSIYFTVLCEGQSRVSIQVCWRDVHLTNGLMALWKKKLLIGQTLKLEDSKHNLFDTALSIALLCSSYLVTGHHRDKSSYTDRRCCGVPW